MLIERLERNGKNYSIEKEDYGYFFVYTVTVYETTEDFYNFLKNEIYATEVGYNEETKVADFKTSESTNAFYISCHKCSFRR
jgi:hypothetical protein